MFITKTQGVSKGGHLALRLQQKCPSSFANTKCTYVLGNKAVKKLDGIGADGIDAINRNQHRCAAFGQVLPRGRDHELAFVRAARIRRAAGTAASNAAALN